MRQFQSHNTQPTIMKVNLSHEYGNVKIKMSK